MRRVLVVTAALLGMIGPSLAEGQQVAPEQQKVSRLPPLPQPLDPILQQMFAKRRALGGAIINLYIATGHSPKFTEAGRVMGNTIRFESIVPRRLVELTIVRTAQIVGSNYELNQHIPFMRMCGYSDAEIAALPNWQVSNLFDDRQRALLGYVDQMANRGDVDDQTFATLQKFFTSKEIVEITYTVGSYYSTGLITKALKIDVENDGRQTAPGTC
jgi:alkylhydroperoxidase family enzyme